MKQYMKLIIGRDVPDDLTPDDTGEPSEGEIESRDLVVEALDHIGFDTLIEEIWYEGSDNEPS